MLFSVPHQYNKCTSVTVLFVHIIIMIMVFDIYLFPLGNKNTYIQGLSVFISTLHLLSYLRKNTKSLKVNLKIKIKNEKK